MLCFAILKYTEQSGVGAISQRREVVQRGARRYVTKKFGHHAVRADTGRQLFAL